LHYNRLHLLEKLRMQYIKYRANIHQRCLKFLVWPWNTENVTKLVKVVSSYYNGTADQIQQSLASKHRPEGICYKVLVKAKQW